MPVILSPVTIFSQTVTVNASEISSNEKEGISTLSITSPVFDTDYDNIPADMLNETVQPRILGKVTVFVAGIVVGYIVDGIIIYRTGQPVSQHIANAMNAARIWYNNKFTSNLSTVCYANGGIF
ncbi:hypothetical protein FAE02_002696 [Enterococcus faecium]|uniref:hypothetical protein n=1 Tax=Enterococcus TaxID=1350 RepID=UPI0009BD7733|nr:MULTISPECIES: hypothetical protein [Enterococcus]AYA33864.1 hypothetical protein CTI32_05360 [Enterococcus faecium]EGP4970300.1 hypothetical protein [Enterococcus faecium]EGP4971192.1 hypothetical protein [Enterococcus faecium]EGP5456381.1 hypothetical protein [Enterococcus faecium]EGP5456982.1 hypothetical protein [Enterococcus faecium]